MFQCSCPKWLCMVVVPLTSCLVSYSLQPSFTWGGNAVATSDGTIYQYCNILPIYQLNIHIDMSYLNIDISFQPIIECISQLLSTYLAHVQFQFHLPVVNCLEWKRTVVWACFMYTLALAWLQSTHYPIYWYIGNMEFTIIDMQDM